MSDQILYAQFEMPEAIKVEEDESTPNRTKIYVEPLERGFGHTLGNAIRRVLMTGIEAPAILSFKMDDVHHEYMAVEGIIEDVTDIIINLKGVLLRRLPEAEVSGSRDIKTLKKKLDISAEQIEAQGGNYIVKVQDIIEEGIFDIVNPEHALFTVTKPMSREVQLRIGFGRGYLPSEKLEGMFEKVNDEILIDALYTPVRKVNYVVEDKRVGGETDLDRLVIDIETDGRITPAEALNFSIEILTKHFSIFDELNFQSITFDVEEDDEPTSSDTIVNKLAMKISEIELSVRATNCLQIANIETIAELVVMQEIDMLKFRNFGKKSLNEIKHKLDEMGLSLGMDLSRYGINKENAKDMVKELLNKEAN